MTSYSSKINLKSSGSQHMQHLRHIFHTKLQLNQLKESRLFKTNQNFMTPYCSQFICCEIFLFLFKAYLLQSYTHETKMGYLWKHKIPERRGKSCHLKKNFFKKINRTHFPWYVPLFIIFLKLKMDCFTECMRQWTKPVGPQKLPYLGMPDVSDSCSLAWELLHSLNNWH